MEMNAGLDHDAETAVANLTALEESQAACTVQTSEWDSILKAMHWVKAMLHETKEMLDGADVLIANLRTSLGQVKLRADHTND